MKCSLGISNFLEEISSLSHSVCNAGHLDSIPGLGRSSGEGNGNPLQYSCLENSMDRGAWWAESMGSQKVGQDRATEHSCMSREKY